MTSAAAAAAAEVTASLVAVDSHAEPSSSTAGPGDGARLSLPNEHSAVGRTSSTASARTVQIKEPPRIDTIPSQSSAAAATGPATGDEHGPLHQAIPAMPLSLAVTCCVLNILLPGIGL